MMRTAHRGHHEYEYSISIPAAGVEMLSANRLCIRYQSLAIIEPASLQPISGLNVS